MRVWIVNPFDNLPAEGFRPQRYWMMAREFARAGHVVVLWTSDFSHTLKRPRRLSGVEGEEFSVRFVPTPPYSRNICLKRIWSHRCFAKRWHAAAEREEAKPDLVVASVPPLGSGLEALRFCRRHSARFIADIQDAWPETFYRVAPRLPLAPWRMAARRIYRGADAISASAERFLELAREAGARCDMREFPLGIEIREVPRRAKGGTSARFVYIGAMGSSYDLETVVEAMKRTPRAELDLAGAGPKEENLRRLAADCGRIRFHGLLNDDALRELLGTADAGLVPMFEDSWVGLPGKLGDYAAARLPVINTLPGETARLLEETGAGWTLPARDVAALGSAMERFASLDGAAREAMSSGAEALARRLDAAAIYPDYVEWVVARAGSFW